MTVNQSQSEESRVLAMPRADPKLANSHFNSRQAFETDPSDVYADLKNGVDEVLVIDARTPETFARGHVPGAINLQHRTISPATTAFLARDKVLVICCDGIFCNASTRPAAKLSVLGFRVKEMLDGMSGWTKEGYPVEESIMQLIKP